MSTECSSGAVPGGVLANLPSLPAKPSEAGSPGRGGARERAQFSPPGGNGDKRTLRRRAAMGKVGRRPQAGGEIPLCTMSSIRILSPQPSRLRRATFPLGGRLRGERRNEVSHKILLPTFLFKKSRSVEAVHGPVGALFQDALHGVGGPLHRLVHDLFVLPLELAQHPARS